MGPTMNLIVKPAAILFLFIQSASVSAASDSTLGKAWVEFMNESLILACSIPEM
jgi:hypothetical protein